VEPVDEVQMGEALDVVESLGVLREDLHAAGAALSADRLDGRLLRFVMRAVNGADWLQRERLHVHLRCRAGKSHSPALPRRDGGLNERRAVGTKETARPFLIAPMFMTTGAEAESRSAGGPK
jgi:hypothetical protein